MNYAAEVLTLFREATHAGELPEGSRGHAKSGAGDTEVVFGAVIRDGRIESVRFGALGCPYVIAACEWVCRRAEGSAPAVLMELDAMSIAAALSAPVEKTGSLLVVEDGLRNLARAVGATPATG